MIMFVNIIDQKHQLIVTVTASEGMMLWKALEHLHLWERENLPGAESPQGNEIVVWLLKCKTKPRPLKDLYRSSRFSEPTIRTYLKEFVDRGFVEIEVNGNDMRTRFARVTPKFDLALAAYRQRFQEVVAFADGVDVFERMSAVGVGETTAATSATVTEEQSLQRA
jgi:DNA-binding MarR family transcriptional regulator